MFQPRGTVGQRSRYIAGTMLTNDPQGQASIAKNTFPNVNVMPVEADGKTYYAATQTDEDGITRGGYINEPGLDLNDVRRFGAQALAFLPAAKYGATGRSFMSRTAKGTGAGATTDVGLQKATQAAGSGRETDYKQSLITGAVGAALETVAPFARSAWNRIFRTNSYFNNRTGQLTPQGRQAAIDAGLDPDDMTQAVIREFSRLAEGGTVPNDILRRNAISTEFGIPTTRGQVTGDYSQLNLEERMRKGLEGPEAALVLKQADEQQRQAIDTAQRQVQTKIAGRDPSERTADAAARVQTGVRDAEAQMAKAVDDAYDAARASGEVRFEQFTPDFLIGAIRGPDFVVDDVLTPATTRGINGIKSVVGAPPGGRVSLGTLDVVRRRINRYIDTAANKEDRRNLMTMKRAVDKYVDEAAALGLMSGDPNAIKQLQQARALRSEYGRMFEGKEAGGKIVKDILEKAESPEQVANYIFGSTQINKQTAINGIKQLKKVLGEGDAWNSVREAAWLRLSRNKNGDFLSPKQFNEAWKKTKYENMSLLNELYTPSEIRLINRYAKALKGTQPESTNPSSSAFALENALRYTLRRFGQRQSFTKGNVAGGTVLNFMARAPLNPMEIRGLAQTRRAEQSIAPLNTPRRSAPFVPAAGQAGSRENY